MEWRHLQAIKNETCGAEMLGVQVFPRESQLIDAVNIYHLFVFEGWHLPFVFTNRQVEENHDKQSIFEAGLRPPELETEAQKFGRVIRNIKIKKN